METQSVKPLGQKGYGTIPHLPGSRRGPGDKGVNDGQFRICCVKTPPDRKGDAVFIQEKLDGSNTGVVKLGAIISKDGTIQHLEVISGHPLLVPAALEAVKQWVYQPTLLNGEPVEVQTQIDVNFTLSQ